MKKLWCVFLLLPLVAQAEVKLDLLWETGTLRTPESVLYVHDGKERFLLVSEIEGDGAEKDGEGGVAKLSLDGDILDQDWVRGLNAPKGMGIHKGKLYVADIDHVVVVDMKSQKVDERIAVPDAQFLNDIAVDSDGHVFVSDTRTHKVHRIHKSESEVFLEDVENANGLTAIGADLYVAAGATLWKADADGGLIKVAEGFEEPADGVEMIADGEFIVTCWAGLVYHIGADGKLTKLIDSRDPRENTADLGWNPDDGTIYIPTFFSDSVKAFSIQ